ncbi:MAG: hypothetical protein ACT4NP_08675 [Pseudonocardiales bacterium]
MHLKEDTQTIARELVALPAEQAAVAALMQPSEHLVGNPPLYEPPAAQLIIIDLDPNVNS